MARKSIGVRTSPDPAAGAEIVFVADEDMIVHSVAFTLVTDVTATNRFVSLVADDGANVFFNIQNGVSQTATTTTPYSAFEGVAKDISGTPSIRNIPLPTTGLRLRKGDRLRTVTQSLQAGDNYGSMVLQVERQYFPISLDFVDA